MAPYYRGYVGCHKLQCWRISETGTIVGRKTTPNTVRLLKRPEGPLWHINAIAELIHVNLFFLHPERPDASYYQGWLVEILRFGQMRLFAMYLFFYIAHEYITENKPIWHLYIYLSARRQYEDWYDKACSCCVRITLFLGLGWTPDKMYLHHCWTYRLIHKSNQRSSASS